MTTTKLNPCGCGGEFEVCYVCGEYFTNCMQCGAGGPIKNTPEEAAAASNTAHPLAIRLEDVREMVEGCGDNGAANIKCAECKHRRLCSLIGPFGDMGEFDIPALTAYVTGKGGEA